MMVNFEKNIICQTKSAEQALNKLEFISENYIQEPLALFVIDEDNKIVGTLTDGDIRRKLLKGFNIDDPIEVFYNPDFNYLKLNEFSLREVQSLYKKNIKLIPILDDRHQIVKVLDFTKKKSVLPLDAVIMAGGEGTRLRPLTNGTPKPLIKVGDKPIVEHNIDRLCRYGIDNITLSIRYLGDQLVSYFGDGSEKDINIQYVREEAPLGTFGALSLIDLFHHDHVLVMNSDLLTTIDLESFYLDFLEKDADMAVASVPYEVKVPYAVLDVNGEGIKSCREKPEYTYYSNAGIYLIKRSLIDRISKEKYLDATDFMEKLISEGKKVTYFPLLGYWLDIGRMEDLERARKDIKLLEMS